MASSSIRSQRRLFWIFVVVSIVLHLLFVGAFIVPPYLQKMKEVRAAAEARQQARQRAAEKRQETARTAEEARHQAAVKIEQEAQQQIAAELKDEFKAVVGEQLKGQDADEMFAEILAQLTAGLQDYSREVAEGDAPDSDLRKGLSDLQAKMLEELAARLRERSRKELADTFVARVRNDVSPKLIEYYRRKLQTKIGDALRDAGTKIVLDDAVEIRAKRQAVLQALTEAERLAKNASLDLAAAKHRLDSATKIAEGLRKNKKDDAADKKLAEAMLHDQPLVEKSAKAVETAGQRLKDAAEKADGLAADTNTAIHAATGEIDRAVKKAGQARDDAKAAKLNELIGSSHDASIAAAKLAEAAHAAREIAMLKDKGDATIEARTALKRARDEELKQLIEKSFWDHYAKKSAPRLGEKLTGVFRQTLEQGGIKDDGIVADVKKRVNDALIDQVRDKIQAGQVGTDPLSKAQHLDDLAGGPHGKNGEKTAGAEVAANGHDAGAEGAGGPATRHSGPDDANHGKPTREDAIAEKIGKAARDLVHANIDGVGDDDGEDEAAVGAVRGKTAGKNAKGDGEDGTGDGLAGLASKASRLAANVKGGRTDLADALGGAGIGVGAGAGGAALPHDPSFDHNHGALLRYHRRYINEAEYAALTAGIHDRDRLAAHGQATTRRSADGDAAISAAADARPLMQAAAVLVPTDKSDPIGQAAKTVPFKPTFRTIRFAAIPYRAKPVTIDGDLSEWKDVPELPLTPAIYGKIARPELKVFPQAVKAQWDNTGFYLAYDVKDADGKITKANPTDFWEGDGIEFWVDTLNTKEKGRTQCTHQFWSWVAGGAKDPTLVGGEAQSWPGQDKYIGLGADVIKTASKKTPEGWTMEVFIPATRFRMLDLQPGRILGMNFSICTGTDLYYYWAGTTDIATARRPDTWGDVLLAGSAGRLECLDKLTSELKPGESARPISSLRIGDSLRIRVTDPDMNLSNTTRDRIAVTISTRRGGRQMVLLEETGDATGIFEGLVRTTPDVGDAATGVLSLLDGDAIELLYTDQCRPDGSRDVPVKLTLPTAAAITKLAGQ